MKKISEENSRINLQMILDLGKFRITPSIVSEIERFDHRAIGDKAREEDRAR